MSNRSKAETGADQLLSVPLEDLGHVLAVGIQGAIYALLDVADAIREQTAALTGDDKRAILIERNQ